MSDTIPKPEKPSNSHLTKSPARVNEFTGGIAFGSKGAYAELEMGTQGGHFMSFNKDEIKKMIDSPHKEMFNIKSLETAIQQIDMANETGMGAGMKRPNSAATINRADYAREQTMRMPDGPEKAQLQAELNKPYVEPGKPAGISANGNDAIKVKSEYVPLSPLTSLTEYLPKPQMEVKQAASNAMRPH